MTRLYCTTVLFLIAACAGQGGAERVPNPPASTVDSLLGNYFAAHPNSPRGRMEPVKYFSSTVGVERTMLVYTPPDYSTDRQYPVLYLMHGIGGDEYEWAESGAVKDILDYLYAHKLARSMIVVLPNGRARVNDKPQGNPFDYVDAFATFERDLLDDVIPFVERSYPAASDAAGRALAGLSMGGGQALNFGLAHLDKFDWVGGFSPAPNTYPVEQLMPEPPQLGRELQLLWLSCGDQDELFSVSAGVHRYLQRRGIEHRWKVHPGAGHDWTVWKSDLFSFARELFRPRG